MSIRFLRKLKKVKTTGNLYASPAEESIAKSRRFKKILGALRVKKEKKEKLIKKSIEPKCGPDEKYPEIDTGQDDP